MRAAIGSQCKLINRGVTFFILSYIHFGSLKINLAATSWINCKGLIELTGRPDIVYKIKIYIKKKTYRVLEIWFWNYSLRYCMNTLLTTTALLNMHIHSLPAGGAFERFPRKQQNTKQRLWNVQHSYLFIAFWSLIVTLSCIAILVCTQI